MKSALYWMLEANAARGDFPRIAWDQAYNMRKCLGDSYEVGQTEQEELHSFCRSRENRAPEPTNLNDILSAVVNFKGGIICIDSGAADAPFRSDQFAIVYRETVQRMQRTNDNGAIHVTINGGGEKQNGNQMVAEAIWHAWKTLKEEAGSGRFPIHFSFGVKSMILLRESVSELGSGNLNQKYSEVQGKLERGISKKTLASFCVRYKTQVKFLLRLDHQIMSTVSSFRRSTVERISKSGLDQFASEYQRNNLSFLEQPSLPVTREARESGPGSEKFYRILQNQIVAAAIRKHFGTVANDRIAALDGEGYIGLDINGPEKTGNDAAGTRIIYDIYRELLSCHAKLAPRHKSGNIMPLVFRIHAGEGYAEGKKITAEEIDQARSNVLLVVRELKRIKSHGLLKPRKIEVRLGHCTHVDGPDLARLANLGVIVEPNLESNRTSGVADSEWHAKAIHLHNYFARMVNEEADRRSRRTRTPRGKKVKLIKSVNGADGNGVMGSSSRGDVLLNQNILLRSLGIEDSAKPKKEAKESREFARVRELTPFARAQLRRHLVKPTKELLLALGSKSKDKPVPAHADAGSHPKQISKGSEVPVLAIASASSDLDSARAVAEAAQFEWIEAAEALLMAEPDETIARAAQAIRAGDARRAAYSARSAAKWALVAPTAALAATENAWEAEAGWGHLAGAVKAAEQTIGMSQMHSRAASEAAHRAASASNPAVAREAAAEAQRAAESARVVAQTAWQVADRIASAAARGGDEQEPVLNRQVDDRDYIVKVSELRLEFVKSYGLAVMDGEWLTADASKILERQEREGDEQKR